MHGVDRRFVRDPGEAIPRQRTVSTDDRPPSDAFTPEERATILAMLAGTRVSTASAAAAPRGFTNAAYEMGSWEIIGEPNGHIYDLIPDELIDVPLDSPV